MSERTRKPARARVAAVLAASMLSVGLLAPSASAATTAVQKADGGSTLLPCEAKWGGYYCDLNDIASALSGLLDPIFKLTCLNPETNFIICRVNTDNTPYDGSN